MYPKNPFEGKTCNISNDFECQRVSCHNHLLLSSLLNMYTYKSVLPSLKTYKILLKVDLLKHQGALNLFMHAEKFRSAGKSVYV